ncbi:hypothetical protein [Aromatoleum anaerobium]|uniref:hypothetical protein n=1 Tax=Aromatoleum anaerobium TaxID=182180 RepID=UPI001FF6DFA8|nr:hypothetical protein [Aromatoleum anaerobium]MCK0507369.1 hypothetical protein [Aromatoleum anaerobium]
MRSTATGTHAHTRIPPFHPGPWRRLGHRLIVAAHGAELPVCEVLPGGVGIEQADANQRLLVAAPELFAVLAAIVADYDDSTQPGPKTMGQARAALQLAQEGRK